MNEKKKYAIKKKKDLGYFYIDPKPSKNEITKYYRDKYFDSCPSYSKETNIDELNFERLYSTIKLQSILNGLNYEDTLKSSDFKNQKNLFEIGSGEGHFLDFCSSIKLFKTVGIDFSTNQNKYNFDSDTNFLSSDDPIEKFLNDFASKTDVLVLNHVVEHIIDPENLLVTLKKYLKKDCLILITVPNDYSVLQTYLNKKNLIKNEYWLSPRDHLSYFNTCSMQNLFKKYSFQILDLFGDYPIEMFNFNESSNYSLNPNLGKQAHNLRCKTASYLIETGIEPKELLELSRSLAKCNLSRSISYLCRSINY